MKITFDAGELDRVEALIAEFADANGLDEAALFDFNVVADELVSNIAKYAYAGSGARPVRVRIAVAGDVVEMEFEDDGQPFNPLERSEPAVDSPLASRPVGGLGVHLVRRLMDEVVYTRADNHNRLVVRKRLANRGRG